MLTTILPAQGKQPYPSPQTYMQRGTSPLNIVYIGAANQTALGTGSLGGNVIAAYPVVISDVVTVDSISCEITVGGAGGFRLGIYGNSSDGVIYPGSLLLDSGEIDVSGAAVKTVSGLSLRLAPGLYWLVRHSLAAVTARAMQAAGRTHLGGMDSTFATFGNTLRAALAYAALPSTFPAGVTWTNATDAAVGLHFSA